MFTARSSRLRCSIEMEHYTDVRSPSNTTRGPVHVSPAEATLQAALDALGDPVRRRIVRELAGVPDWSRACAAFHHLPVAKSTLSHHFAVLRGVGLLEQREQGARRLNRLRRPEFDARFPGLLALVLDEDET
jgi:DNA-binding transcriptional ArsR family regulator